MKQCMIDVFGDNAKVTLHARVWIETGNILYSSWKNPSHPPREGVD